ncbi:hypothetical protein [Luteibaculum oceani]|uniref:DUF4861 domain-containing protein n=1 Tax=Luteibaculum oceani TaxID=1294296 RepID=A0A5C6UXH5_9FLAO|nr:hypothetical protein [Luteibaculum oceani]TXC76941.1 hypothetical protein FRX97_10015 [Luteibaculum oceani]
MRKLLIINLLSIVSLGGTAQSYLNQLEDSIKFYRALSLNSNTDTAKLLYNDRVVTFLKTALEQDAAAAFGFDELEKFSVLKEGEVTLVTWNLELNRFNNEFYGVVGYRDRRTAKSKVLLDRGIRGKEDEKEIFDNKNWPGAVYYRMVPFKRKNGRSYLLLGWRGDNALESYKVAEVLSINKAGITFGFPVLVTENGDRLNRFTVHYPSNMAYSMKYDEKEKQFYYNRLGLIDESLGKVFNNLTPTYTFDAFKYKGGKWIKKTNVEVIKPK